MDDKVTPKLLTAILSAGMLSFLGILDETATTVTFPTLIREFAVTTDQVQWVNTLVLLVIATIVPISSQISLRCSDYGDDNLPNEQVGYNSLEEHFAKLQQFLDDGTYYSICLLYTSRCV